MDLKATPSRRPFGQPFDYKVLPSVLWVVGLILFGNIFAACVTGPSGVAGVRLKMDKSEVLEVAGNPKQTFRENNKDHWIYSYSSERREWSRIVTFSDGKVVKVGRPIPKDSPLRELEETRSLEEFEAKARSLQKSRSGADKFKDIGGSAD